MQRSELAGTVLQLKALGVDNMMAFDWLAPPPAETMVRALELLHALGALGADARSAPLSCPPWLRTFTCRLCCLPRRIMSGAPCTAWWH